MDKVIDGLLLELYHHRGVSAEARTLIDQLREALIKRRSGRPRGNVTKLPVGKSSGSWKKVPTQPCRSANLPKNLSCLDRQSIPSENKPLLNNQLKRQSRSVNPMI